MINSASHTARVGAQAALRIRLRERLLGTASLVLPNRVDPSSPHAWENGSPILIYHRIVENSEICHDPFAVRRDAFESQIVWLSQTCTLLTAGELARRLLTSELSTDTAAITFDDGFACTFEHAWYILRSYGIPATIFIDTGRLEGSPSSLTHKQIRMMADENIEIGSHSVSHADLRTLSDTKLLDELVRSRESLSEITGRPIYGFAYPFGRYDERIVQFIRKAGYKYACSCRQHRSNHSHDDPYLLCRVEININDTLRRFQHKVTGKYASVYATWYRINPATRLWLTG